MTSFFHVYIFFDKRSVGGALFLIHLAMTALHVYHRNVPGWIKGAVDGGKTKLRVHCDIF